MRVLIIGSQGFIGSNCFWHLTAKGHEVYGADIVPGTDTSRSFLLGPSAPDFKNLFLRMPFDACINASGSADVGSSFADPEKDRILNVVNVQRMLEAIAEFSPACKFINFSSAAVYGNPATLPVKETAGLQPLSPYGRNKLASEELLKASGLKTCSLRVFSAYGPGLRKQLFWDLYSKCKVGGELRLFGTGKESRDFIYISDLASAVDSVLQKGVFSGECVNVASGEEQSIEKVARLFVEAYAPGKKIVFSGEEKKGDPKNWRADVSVLSAYGFHCSVSIEQGISNYTEWLRKEEK